MVKELKIDDARAAEALTDAAVSVFAEMAFMDALPMAGDAEKPVGGTDAVHVALDVLKPLSCRLELILSRNLADRISDNLYGTADMGFQEEASAGSAAAARSGDRSRDDSALELLNVLAGGFLSGYFGAGTPFKLELPFFVFGEEETEDTVTVRRRLDVEGLPAEVLLSSVRYRY